METFFKNLTPEEGAAEKLLHDFSVVREDTEELFRATGGLAERSKEKFLMAVDKVKASCNEIHQKAVAGAKSANRTIRENPYPAVGLALGLGLVVGVLVRRR